MTQIRVYLILYLYKILIVIYIKKYDGIVICVSEGQLLRDLKGVSELSTKKGSVCFYNKSE